MAEPKYRQIAERLSEIIGSGELPPGAQLPTENELRERFGASRSTVREAIKLLVNRRMVETRQGQGTFVLQAVDPFVTSLSSEIGKGDHETVWYASEVAASNRTAATSAPEVDKVRATKEVAAALGLPPGSRVVRRAQNRYIDGMVWSRQTTYYPMRYVDSGADLLVKPGELTQGAVSYLEAALGIEQAGWRDMITVRKPDAREAEIFGLPDDGRIAVIEIFRTAFEPAGEPLRLTVTLYPADRNQFVMQAGKVPAGPRA